MLISPGDTFSRFSKRIPRTAKRSVYLQGSAGEPADTGSQDGRLARLGLVVGQRRILAGLFRNRASLRVFPRPFVVSSKSECGRPEASILSSGFLSNQ